MESVINYNKLTKSEKLQKRRISITIDLADNCALIQERKIGSKWYEYYSIDLPFEKMPEFAELIQRIHKLTILK